MEHLYGFTLLDIDEFEAWIATQNVARTVLFIQQHHTFSPNYRHFSGGNHFSLQKGMKNYHVNNNGWNNIGQHFTIFPDGKIVTGRSLEDTPACIYGKNEHSICIENLGDFDTGNDEMNNDQKQAIIRVTAALCTRFGVPVNSDRIVYHHWFDLSNGTRKNGEGVTKSCPGTAFFGGNKVADCEANFLPLVNDALNGVIDVGLPDTLMKYGYVTASKLNIRKGSSTNFSKLGFTTLGAVLRIYKEKEGWYKISETKHEWVYSGYVKDIERAVVSADVLNVRSGPSTDFNIVGSVVKNQEVFVYEQVDNWSKISLDNQWISNSFVSFVM